MLRAVEIMADHWDINWYKDFWSVKFSCKVVLVAFFIYRSRAQDSTTAADELRRRFGGESFDFILDDGDHNAAAVERSFKRLFFGTMVYL